MSSDNTAVRTAIVRIKCGSVYAGQRWQDGTIIRLGRDSDCRYGGTEFREVNLSEEDS